MGNALSTVGEAVLRLAAASQNAEAETRPLAHAHGGLGAAATSPDAGGDLAHDDHAMRDGGGQSVRFSFRRLQNMLSNTLLRVEPREAQVDSTPEGEVQLSIRFNRNWRDATAGSGREARQSQATTSGVGPSTVRDRRGSHNQPIRAPGLQRDPTDAAGPRRRGSDPEQGSASDSGPTVTDASIAAPRAGSPERRPSASAGGAPSGAGTAGPAPPAAAFPSTTRFDLQMVILWLEQALPFLFLLLCIFLKQHFVQLLMYAMLSFMVVKANVALQRTIAMRSEASNNKLAVVASGLFVSTALTLLIIFRDDKLWQSLVFIPPEPTKIRTLWDAVFRSALCDVIARQVSTWLKAVYLLAWKPRPGRMFRRQGHLLTFMEYATMLYSVLVPVPIWYRYFQRGQLGQILSSATTGFYLTLKFSAAFEKALLFFASLKAVVRPMQAAYGCRASTDDVIELGDMCSICQDTLKSPLKLRPCRHIFCEDCISEWLDRDTTCPLCRTVVKSETCRSYSDGGTGWVINIF